MWNDIVEAGIRLLIPKAGDTAVEIAADMVAGIAGLIDDILDDPTDHEAIIAAVQDAMDTAMDAVPGWAAKTEEDRDEILGKIAELALLIADEVAPAVEARRPKVRGWGRRRVRVPRSIVDLTRGQ